MKKFSAYHIWQNVVIFHSILLFSMVLPHVSIKKFNNL